MAIVLKISGFLQKAWKIAVTEPKKVMHCVKVGLALSIVSLFYYMKPLYNGVGGNAMWAVMTVVVVFEYTVGRYLDSSFGHVFQVSCSLTIYTHAGATLSKSVNRATGTFLAGALGVGVHWIAIQSGEKLQPVILQASVFILGSLFCCNA